MKKLCKKCKKVYDVSVKECPVCKEKLKKEYTEEEIRQLEEQKIINAVTNVINLF